MIQFLNTSTFPIMNTYILKYFCISAVFAIRLNVETPDYGLPRVTLNSDFQTKIQTEVDGGFYTCFLTQLTVQGQDVSFPNSV